MRDTYPDLPTLPAAMLVPPERQPDYVEPPGTELPELVNVGRAILDAAPPDALALVGHDRRTAYTFGDLERVSAQLGSLLTGSGVRMGDRVAIRAGNRPEAVIAILAAWRIGAIVVPTPPHARTAELRFMLEDAQATALVADAGAATFDDVPPAVDGTTVRIAVAFGCDEAPTGWIHWREQPGRPADDVDVETPGSLPALIWHTGGTTGTPKACYHTHRRYLLAGSTFRQATRVEHGERWLAAAPIGHALGFLCHTSFTLLHGATAVMVEDYAKPSAVLEAIAEHDVTTLVAIAATWSRLLDTLNGQPELDRIPSLRRAYAMWQSASSSSVYDGWLARRIELLNNFGSTAFANWILIPQSPATPRASLGLATPGYEVRAIAMAGGSLDPVPAGTTGRMAVRGPTALTYWNRPSEQERDVVDGWTLVDDLIEFDDASQAAYHGRTDFVISSGGHKIAPIEVETVLATHPCVKEVAVVGTPDPLRVEIVTAFVVLRDDHIDDDRDLVRKELQDLVKSEIAPYKYPRRVEFIEALPRDPVGKILPRVLKEWGSAGVPA